MHNCSLKKKKRSCGLHSSSWKAAIVGNSSGIVGGKCFWHNIHPIPSWSTQFTTLILGLHILYNNIKSNKDKKKNRICQQPGLTFSLVQSFSCFIFFPLPFFGCLQNCCACVCTCARVCVHLSVCNVWALNHLNPWPSTLSVRLVVSKNMMRWFCVVMEWDIPPIKPSPDTESCVFPMGKENWKDALFA